MKGTSISLVLLGCGALCASTRVLADDLLGLYVGAAVGQSHVRVAQEILGDTDYDYKFDEQHTGWKVTVGIRPISPLGVEIDYLDFGNPRTGQVLGFGGLTQADAKAWTLFGLGYLPLPVPFLDVYGKLGIARLHTTSTEVGPIPDCPAFAMACISPAPFSISESTTHVAYGAGVQGKIGALALRGEYERISASGGGSDLASVGVTWTF